jgi:hypothetical protein
MFKLIVMFFTISVLIAPVNVFSKEQTSLTYDFTFAELAVKYLETGDSKYLNEISNLAAAEHIFNHALQTGYEGTKLELITNLLSPIEDQKEKMPAFK